MKLFGIAAASVLCAVSMLHGMEWRLQGKEIVFTAGAGKHFIFRPSSYSGIICGKSNFFFHVPNNDKSGKRLADLRLSNRITSASVVVDNEFCKVVKVVVPMIRLHEATGKIHPTPTETTFYFRLWRDLPVLEVSSILINREQADLRASLFWVGKIQQFDSYGGTISSPPPEHFAVRKVGCPSVPGGDVLVVYDSTNKTPPLGVIGRVHRHGSLQLFRSWTNEMVPFSGSMNFDLAFAYPNSGGEAGYRELLTMRRAMDTLGTVARCNAGTYGLFRYSKQLKDAKGKVVKVLKGTAHKQTYVHFSGSTKEFNVSYHCEEPDPSKMKATFTAGNDPVWEDDCVELFMAADWSKRGFYQYVANAKGASNQLSYNIPLNHQKIAWRFQPAMGKNYWTVKHTLGKGSFDAGWLSQEGYLPLHVNRESHHSNEYTGWPSGTFKDPSKFGRLIFCDYSQYLSRQVHQIEKLLTGNTSKLAPEFAELRRTLPTFDENDYFKNALADASLREFRRRVDFQLSLEHCHRLLEQVKQTADAGKDLSRALDSLEKSIEKTEMRQAYNRLRGDVLRHISLGANFLVWNKSPWVYLNGDDYPVAGKDYTASSVLHAGIGEYESAAFAITNFTDQTREVTVKVRDNPSDIPVVLRYCFVSRSSMGEVNDALPLLTGPLTLPPRKSREIQLTLNTFSMKPGKHLLTLAFSDGTKEQIRKVILDVHPVRLDVPDKLFNRFFAPVEMMKRVTGLKNLKVFFDDMHSHYYRVHLMNGGGIPKPQYDENGANLTDYKHFVQEMLNFDHGDYKVSSWGLNGKMDIEEKLHRRFGVPTTDPRFRPRFASWLKDWYRAMHKAGINTDNLYMSVLDENTQPSGIAMVKMAKEIMPDMKIFLTFSTSSTLSDLRQLLPHIDAIAPHFYTWQKKKELWEEIAKHQHVILCPYFNVAPAAVKDEPYSVYRRMGWLAKSVGAHGCGTWVYFYYFNSWAPVSQCMVHTKHQSIPSSLQGAPKKLAPGEILIPTKRWEGYRDGMDEFYYIRMLEKRIAQNPNSAWSRDAKKLLITAIRHVCEDEEGAELDIAAKQKLRMLNMLENY